MTEKIIKYCYEPCKRCIGLDPIVQDKIAEKNKNDYLTNMKGLFEIGVLNDLKFKERVAHCDECMEKRIDTSMEFKNTMTKLENEYLKNPGVRFENE